MKAPELQWLHIFGLDSDRFFALCIEMRSARQRMISIFCFGVLTVNFVVDRQFDGNTYSMRSSFAEHTFQCDCVAAVSNSDAKSKIELNQLAYELDMIRHNFTVKFECACVSRASKANKEYAIIEWKGINVWRSRPESQVSSERCAYIVPRCSYIRIWDRQTKCNDNIESIHDLSLNIVEWKPQASREQTEKSSTSTATTALNKYTKFMEWNEQSTGVDEHACVCSTLSMGGIDGDGIRKMRNQKFRTHLVVWIWPKNLWLSIQYRVRSLK